MTYFLMSEHLVALVSVLASGQAVLYHESGFKAQAFRTRECLAILVKRRITSQDVIGQLFQLIIFRGIPEHIRSDNRPEFTAKAIIGWLNRPGVKTLFIGPGRPWENGYTESFNGKLRDELLNREVFYTLAEAKVLIEQWRKEYNQIRSHSSSGYRTPAPGAVIPVTLT